MQRKQWSAVDTELLRRHYHDSHTADLARVLGRDERSVYSKAAAMGLKKSEDYLASAQAGRIQRGRADPRMVATQFKPGLVPWNKGVRYEAGGRSAQTRFKPGGLPHTTLAVGTLRITRDGILQRKFSDAKYGSPSRRWRSVHRLVWEAAHGPVPDGHIVVFKPGRFTNLEADITLDRLECISQADNARRNHPRNKSPELARLYQLKGAITRQANRIAREAAEHESSRA